MKSAMPFHGVGVLQLRAACREVFAAYPFADAESWRADVLDLWHRAEYREERHAAIVLSGHRKARDFQTLDALPMYEEMIVTGAWWDFVDEIATHRVGPLLVKYPREMRRVMRAWSRSPDMWKRRTSIICQVPLRGEADLELLYACIEPSLASKEFFLRKAIGWALRQVAWQKSEEIARYVAEHERELSPLSRREALKNIGR